MMVTELHRPVESPGRISLMVAAGLLITVLSGCRTLAEPGALPANANPEDLLTVDCLLPPQVRQLGTDATYFGPRRPLRTSGAECELRGGEYVAYDRADFKSALAVWLPRAQQGDPVAQTYVGEIHEKGMGTRASYELAAAWYAKAAEQNHSRAQINLGYLYESGLGVERDLARALNLYRQASGFTSAELEYVSSVDIARREATIRDNARLNADIRILQSSIARGQQALDTKSRELQQSQAEIDALQTALQYHLTLAQNPSPDDSSHDAASIQSVREMQKELAARNADLQDKREAISSLRAQLLDQQAQLPPKAVERTVETVSEGPAISIIDPPVTGTGPGSPDRPTVIVDGSTDGVLSLIGRIEPADNLYALQINGNDLSVSDTGMFRYRAESDTTKVHELLAVDNEGMSTRLSVSLQPQQTSSADAITQNMDTSVAQTRSAVAFEETDFGEYHALIIGNGSFEHLDELNTAVKDAMAVEQILREKYGFKTVLLINADRHALLSALESFRVSLGRTDNFLVYYAGHGLLDPVSGRGYWLPTDARIDSKEQWIANSAITALIDLIAAKHVIIIADASYSGTMTRSSVARPLPEASAELRNRWLKAVSKTRVRTVLSSGGTRPVAHDPPYSEYSVFARKLIDVLEQNTEVLEAYEIFFRLQSEATGNAARFNEQQMPRYAPLRHAGHQAGDFIFLPRKPSVNQPRTY